jgi:bacterioferritin-associated ferredoxin
MIVCSCNVFNDSDVRDCLHNGTTPPKTAREVYGRLGCAPKCGRCAQTIECILRQTAKENAARETVQADAQAEAA